MGLKRAAHGDASRETLSGAPTASDAAPSKKAKFDHRNPSTLASEAPDEDALLELDEIGRAGLTAKRNAVKLEGYDSDSSQENFDVRAEEKVRSQRKAERDAKSKDEEQEDMFADVEEAEVGADGDDDEDLAREGKKRKEVRFMENSEIEGQVGSSKAGGHVSADFSVGPDKTTNEHETSSDDESEGGDERRDALEGDIDEELGAGSKKQHAPRLDAFHMRNEAEEGRFDASGNFVRNAKDPFAVHDAWMEGNSSKAAMRKAAKAEEDREKERRERDLADDAVGTGELLGRMIEVLEVGETALEALQRLGRGKKEKKAAFKKNRRKGEMDLDGEEKAVNGDTDDSAEKRRKYHVEALTSAADALMTRGQTEIYDSERELLERQYKNETGNAWRDPEPDPKEEANDESNHDAGKMWHYRWADARDGGTHHGPYDGPTMKAWNEAGYFGDGVEFKQDGLEHWERSVEFI
ncbi:MAG: hypothetical protein Q9162_001337 [Coniocarpon cinnabarinum]